MRGEPGGLEVATNHQDVTTEKCATGMKSSEKPWKWKLE